MKKSLIIIVIYLIFSIAFSIYSSNKKYIILNNDYMFELNSKIKVVKKYPSYINNTKINYYNGTIKQDGFIKIKNKKLTIDQENGNNIDFYSSDYKKILSSNLVATYGLKDLNLLNVEKYISDRMSDEDETTIKDFLEQNGIDDFSIKYFRRYLVDINNDKAEDRIYIIGNMDVNSSEKGYSLEFNSSLEESEDYYQYAFVKTGSSYIKLFELNEDNSSGKIFYELRNIFDVNNDSIYELNFSKSDDEDYNYHCESIFKLENNKFVEYKNCISEED